MLDNILESRIQKSKRTICKFYILFSANKEDLIKKVERNHLSLRKNQIEQYIMNKRLARHYDNPPLEINPFNLYVPDNQLENIQENYKNVSKYYFIYF
jgi:hypothetical protein